LGLLPADRAKSMIWRITAFAAVATMIVGFTAAWQRFSDPDPFFLRREVLISATRMLQDRPTMGFGLGTWAVAYPQYAVFDPGAVINQTHNDWMQWAVEGGLPFAGLMLTFAALLLPAALRSVWGVGVVFVLLHSFVDYPLQQRPALAVFFFAVAGAVAASQRRAAGVRPSPQRVLSVQASFSSGPPKTMNRPMKGS
jgi:O-antigen ligase